MKGKEEREWKRQEREERSGEGRGMERTYKRDRLLLIYMRIYIIKYI